MADKNEIINDLLERGVENIIPGPSELRDLLNSDKKLNIYLGIDPTSSHIHLGHAFNLRKLQQFVELGHNVTLLVGDFTALVGDTSDKDTERPILSSEDIAENVKSYKSLAQKFIDLDRAKLLYNSSWLKDLSYAELIKLMSHFSVNDFNSRELIRRRLDAGTRVALPEVLYPIMQGYDSYHLDTDIQLGGTDQTFNMQAGRTLLKRLKDKESCIIASGFLTGNDGRKMSKSWGNAIWLDDSPSDVYGKAMSINDDLIIEYFTFGTSLPLGEIDEIKKELESGAHPMEIKKRLAAQIVSELNGSEHVEQAETHFKSTVQDKSATDDAPVITLTQNSNIDELVDALISQGLASSKSELRRLNDQGGVYLEDDKVDLWKLDIPSLTPGSHQLRLGKRRYAVLEIK